MVRLTIVLIAALLAAPIGAVEVPTSKSSPQLSEVLSLMAAHDEWQDRHLIEYQAQRKFHGANKRFNMESTLEVTTHFRRPDTLESKVVRSEGSKLIRERVFDKILEAEQQTQGKDSRNEVRITPANYKFALVGKEDCKGRACYHLQITPRHKDKYSINGQIWVDAEEGAIVRLLGSPAKSPSFWTRKTDIERRYMRIDGVWLCEAMESTGEIFLGGRSTLRVDYTYITVHTESSVAAVVPNPTS